MIRQVIKIDEDKCTGCGICADACQEGAIGIVDGKAKLLRDDYCAYLPVRLMRFLLKPVKPQHLMKMR